MKDSAELLLIKYRDSGLDERMTMYLAYRELRDDFENIEAQETMEVPVNLTPKARSLNLLEYVSKHVIRCWNLIVKHGEDRKCF